MIQLNKILKSFQKTIDQLEQLTAANRGVIVQPPLGDEADLRHVHEELYGRGGLLSFEERVIDDILDMLEELGANPLSFEGVYLDAKGESRPCYPIPHREIEDMASELSLSFEQKVIDDILSMLEELEKDASSFAHIYLDAMNRSQTEYHLPRVQGSSSSSIGFQGISEGRERALNTFSALRRW